MHLDGFKYWLAYKKGTKSYYRCSRSKSQKCPGKVIMDGSKVLTLIPHDHDKESRNSAVEKFRKVLTKKAVEKPSKSLVDIYLEETLNHSEASILYPFSQAESTMRKARRGGGQKKAEKVVKSVKEETQPVTNRNSQQFQKYFYVEELTEDVKVILMNQGTLKVLGKIEEVHIDCALKVDVRESESSTGTKSLSDPQVKSSILSSCRYENDPKSVPKSPQNIEIPEKSTVFFDTLEYFEEETQKASYNIELGYQTGRELTQSEDFSNQMQNLQTFVINFEENSNIGSKFMQTINECSDKQDTQGNLSSQTGKIIQNQSLVENNEIFEILTQNSPNFQNLLEESSKFESQADGNLPDLIVSSFRTDFVSDLDENHESSPIPPLSGLSSQNLNTNCLKFSSSHDKSDQNCRNWQKLNNSMIIIQNLNNLEQEEQNLLQKNQNSGQKDQNLEQNNQKEQNLEQNVQRLPENVQISAKITQSPPISLQCLQNNTNVTKNNQNFDRIPKLVRIGQKLPSEMPKLTSTLVKIDGKQKKISNYGQNVQNPEISGQPSTNVQNPEISGQPSIFFTNLVQSPEISGQPSTNCDKPKQNLQNSSKTPQKRAQNLQIAPDQPLPQKFLIHRYHIITIIALIKGRDCPIAFAILKSPNFATFHNFLQFLSVKISLNPTTVLTNDNPSIQQSISSVWPEATVKVMYFHYAQSVLKKLHQNYQEMSKNIFEMSSLKMILSMPLIPTNYVIPGWEALRKWMSEKNVNLDAASDEIYVQWLAENAERISIFNGLTHSINNHTQVFQSELINSFGASVNGSDELVNRISRQAMRSFLKFTKTSESVAKRIQKLEKTVKIATKNWISSPFHLRRPIQFLQQVSHCIDDGMINFVMNFEGWFCERRKNEPPPLIFYTEKEKSEEKGVEKERKMLTEPPPLVPIRK